MPILNVKVSAKKSPEMTKSISCLLLDLTTRILKKKPEVIYNNATRDAKYSKYW